MDRKEYARLYRLHNSDVLRVKKQQYYVRNRELLKQKQYARAHRAETGGIVYFICEQRGDKLLPTKWTDQFYVKIGYVTSTKPEKRLSTLNCGNPRKLSIYKKVECTDPNKFEYLAKTKLKEYRVDQKKEWYYIPKYIMDGFIDELENEELKFGDPVRYVYLLFI